MGSKTPDISGSYENSHRINAMAINFVMVDHQGIEPWTP